MLARMMNDFAPLLRLHQDVNRLFEGFVEDQPDDRPYGAAYPALNTWEDGDAAWVEAELPGLTMADLEVLVAGNELTINGRRTIAAPEGASYHRRERARGAFARTHALPWAIDAERVEATLRDGVLCVKLPKAESAKPKKIEVRGA